MTETRDDNLDIYDLDPLQVCAEIRKCQWVMGQNLGKAPVIRKWLARLNVLIEQLKHFEEIPTDAELRSRMAAALIELQTCIDVFDPPKKPE